MAWWTHCTKTGRVVYDRAVHKFAWCDAHRIVKKLPDPIEQERSMGCFLGVLIEILAEIDRNPAFLGKAESDDPDEPNFRDAANLLRGKIDELDAEFPGFGGGEFGGAGASREFGDSGVYGPDADRPEDAPPPWLLPFYIPEETEENE
mgnify:CR=1 FL=1